MKKQKQLFFALADEEEFSQSLRERFADVVILDGNVWTTADPVVCTSIAAYREPFAFIWSRKVTPDLPVMQRKDGQFQGPASGVVIQVIRSRLRGDVLESGRIAVGSDPANTAFIEFVSEVWRVLGRFGTIKLASVDPTTRKVITPGVREYRVGPHAAAFLRTGALEMLKDRSTKNFYLPE